MRTRRSWPIILATVTAVAFGALAALPADAQQAPTPDRGAEIVQSWALTPTGAPDANARNSFSFDVAGGQEIRDTATLFNYGNVQMTFRVYATDAFNNLDGNFDLLTGDKQPVDAGAWLTLPQTLVTVPARTSADLPFTLRVPSDAAPGDHVGALLASAQAEGTGPDGKLISLDRRTGTRMYVRVSGPLTPRLTVEAVRASYETSLNPFGGKVKVEYTVRNRGNVRLAGRARLEVDGPLGIGLGRQQVLDVPELLPNNSVRLTTTAAGVPAPFLVKARITVDPAPASDGLDLAQAGARRATWVIAVPWTLLVLGASAALLRYAYRSYRRPGAEEEDLDDLDDLEELGGEDTGQEADDNAVPAG